MAAQPGVFVEPASGTPWLMVTLIGSAVVLIVLLAICFCTCRHLKKGKADMEADFSSVPQFQCIVHIAESLSLHFKFLPRRCTAELEEQ